MGCAEEGDAVCSANQGRVGADGPSSQQEVPAEDFCTTGSMGRRVGAITHEGALSHSTEGGAEELELSFTWDSLDPTPSDEDKSPGLRGATCWENPGGEKGASRSSRDEGTEAPASARTASAERSGEKEGPGDPPKPTEDEVIRILTINVRGLREDQKVEELKQVLFDFQVGVGIITETHLSKKEADALNIPGFRVENSDARPDDIYGGVCILVADSVVCTKLEDVPRPAQPVSACSVLLYPERRGDSCIRITGVYLPPPPTALITPEWVDPLTNPEAQSRDIRGDMISHLLVGDFNQHSWAGGNDEKYHEWVTGSGAWELSDPEVPTHRQGSALDKFLLLPGRDIPEAFLCPPSCFVGGDVEGEEDAFYPARTYPTTFIADHHPVVLEIPGSHMEPGVRARMLRVKQLTKDEWREKNEEMLEYIGSHREEYDKALRGGNCERMLGLLGTMIEQVFREHYIKSGGVVRRCHPFQLFCKKHLGHPDLPQLLKAEQEGNKQALKQLYQTIIREDWRDHLGRLSASDTSALFSFLAREDGRRPRGMSYSCASPLQDAEGNRRFTEREKCELLADSFELKLTDPMRGGKGRKKGGKKQNKGQSKNIRNAAQSRTGQQEGVGFSGKGKGKGKYRYDKGKQKGKGKGTRLPTHVAEGYRKPMRGEFEKFRQVEVAKAVRSLAAGKAAGPDGLPAEIFCNLSATWELVGAVFNGVMGRGVFPSGLRRLYIIPLDKPGRNPERCESKRPISLICALAKALEAAVYHRLVGHFEPLLDKRQYAYRRARGTEMHLLEMHEFALAAGEADEFLYLASIDVDSAFDAVPHSSLIASFEEAGVDSYTCRYLHKWLRTRFFRVRLLSPRGRFYSTYRQISRGLPQGGVLSPFLWIVHINPLLNSIEKGVRDRIAALGLPDRFCICLLLYADDVICTVRCDDLDLIVCIAAAVAEAIEESLGRLGLRSTPVKSKNFVRPPGFTHTGLFRRCPNAFREGVLGLRKRDEELEQSRSMEGEFGLSRESTFASMQERLPYPFAATIKISGVVFDMRFCFEAQVKTILDRAKIRIGVVSRLAGCTWGAETAIMRLTGDALVISLMRYALAVIGSGMYEQSLRRLEVCVVNVLARKVIGVGRSARLPVLHATAGILSAHNLYAQHCADMVDHTLRAEGSSVKERVMGLVCQAYQLQHWELAARECIPSTPLSPRVYRRRFFDMDLREQWFCDVLVHGPDLESRLKVGSVFHTGAVEAEARPDL